MNCKVEKTNKATEVKLEITNESEKFDEAIKKVYFKSAKYFNIPGFRKGKAPMQIVERYYGKEIFYEDAFNEVAQEALEEAVKENKLEEKIILYGQLPREKISEFWNNKDIFIAVSDKEGCCLSMMEAMASGAVPVVTGFSVSYEYVSVPKNGYVVPFGDMETMAECIGELYNHPNTIKEKSISCIEYIRKHCSYNSYRNFLFNLYYHK